MSIFSPSHLSVVTDRSDASVIHQNFMKLHSELQALKQYVKKLPTEVPAVPKQEIPEVKTMPNLIVGDSSFEDIGRIIIEDNVKPIGIDIYPLLNSWSYPIFFFGNRPCVLVSANLDKPVRALDGYTAAVVDGTVIDFVNNRFTGRSIPTMSAPRHIYAEQSGGYTLSAYVSAYHETVNDGQCIMKVHLLEYSDEETDLNIEKTWSSSFPIKSSEKFKWTRYHMTIPISDIPDHSSTVNRIFVIEFSSTTPYLLDAVQFVPLTEPSLYSFSPFFYITPEQRI